MVINEKIWPLQILITFPNHFSFLYLRIIVNDINLQIKQKMNY